MGETKERENVLRTEQAVGKKEMAGRPKASWFTWLFLAAVLGMEALSVVMKIVLQQFEDAQGITRYLYGSMAGKQITYCGMGLIVLLFAAFYDFRKWTKHSRILGAGFVVVVLVLFHFCGQTNVYRWIRLGSLWVNPRQLPYFTLPIYAAILYRMRGKKTGVFTGAFLWAVILLIPMAAVGSFPTMLFLTTAFLTLFNTALFSGWFQMQPGKILKAEIFFGVLFVGSILLAAVYALNTPEFSGYRVHRLKDFLEADSSEGYNYYALIRKLCRLVLGECSLFGASAQAMKDGITQMQDQFLDYSLISISAVFGIAAAVGVVLLQVVLIVMVVVRSAKYRNTFSKVLSIGSAGFLAVELLWIVLRDCHLIPTAMAELPFFTSGVSLTIAYFLVAGLIVNADRFRNMEEAAVTVEKVKKLSLIESVLQYMTFDEDLDDLDEYEEEYLDRPVKREGAAEGTEKGEIVDFPKVYHIFGYRIAVSKERKK